MYKRQTRRLESTNIRLNSVDVALEVDARDGFMPGPCSKEYITTAQLERSSDSGWGDVAVSFVVRFSNTRPNAVHEFVVMSLAVVEAPIRFSKRIGFLARGDEISFRREARNDGSHFPTSRKIADRFSGHGRNPQRCYINSWQAVNT